MSMPAVQETGQVIPIGSKSKQPKDRFVYGDSGCYVEIAEYISNDPTVNVESADVIRLMNNPAMYLAETEGKGRSLKIMLDTSGHETKFVGFVTHGDAKRGLTKDDIDPILEHTEGCTFERAISPSELVSMW
jgi:hypothetical protein